MPPRFQPRRALGRTGFVATRLGQGDLADRAVPRERCVAVLRRALADLQSLPEEARAALLLRAEGLPYDEIAQALGITPGAAKVRVHRARTSLAARESAREPRGDGP